VPHPLASATDAFDPDADDLIAALGGDEQATTRLVSRFQDRLYIWAHRKAPDLAVFDRFDDAVSRTWELLMRRDIASFDPARVRARTFLAQLLRCAIRDVRAAHAPPGQRTRQPARDDTAMTWPGWAITIDDIVDVDMETITLEEPIDAILDALAADEILALADVTAPQLVAEGLHAVHDEGLTLTQAAAKCGRHRSNLRRAIDRWTNEQHIEL